MPYSGGDLVEGKSLSNEDRNLFNPNGVLFLQVIIGTHAVMADGG